MVFRVVLLTPTGSNTLRLYFNKEPRHNSPLGASDGLSRMNYTLSVVSGPGAAPVIEAVENPAPRPDDVVGFPLAWSVDLRLDRRILANTVYLVIASASLLAADDDPMAASPLDRDDAPGDITARTKPREAPPATRPGVDFQYDFFSGVFQIDPRGDLGVHAGIQALKKRILRRLLSRPGGFYHLPTYGVGLRVKEASGAGELNRLRQRIFDQIRQEEEVADLDVRVAFLAPGALLVAMRVRAVEGTEFGLEFEVPSEGPLLLI